MLEEGVWRILESSNELVENLFSENIYLKFGFDRQKIIECLKLFKDAYSYKVISPKEKAGNEVKYVRHTVYGVGRVVEVSGGLIRAIFKGGLLRSFCLSQLEVITETEYKNSGGIIVSPQKREYSDLNFNSYQDDFYYYPSYSEDTETFIKNRFDFEREHKRDYYDDGNKDDYDGVDYMDDTDYDYQDYIDPFDDDD